MSMARSLGTFWPEPGSSDPKLRQVFVRPGPLQLQGFKGSDHRFGDDKIAIPLAVGGNDMPRRVRGAAEVDGILVGLHEPGPMRAHLEVFGLKLPILAWVLQAGPEAFGLFL